MNVAIPLSTALLFFVVIPGVGVLTARARWRRFRRGMLEAALNPTAGRDEIAAVHRGKHSLGMYRFFGTLEALQDDDRLWVTDGSNTVEVDMSGATVYLLPEGLAPDLRNIGLQSNFEAMLQRLSAPEIVPWRHMTSLTEGTRVFVYGQLESGRGVPLFRGTRRDGPLVILYDGLPGDLLARAIWFGRERNEYWNMLTPPSLIAGMFVLVILAVQAFGTPGGYTSAILTLGLAAVPILPLLPPGVVGFFLYRKLWMKGRAKRAWRDLLKLSLVFTTPGESGESQTLLPDGERYVMKTVSGEEVEQYVERGAAVRTDTRSSREQRWIIAGALRDGRIERPKDPMAELALLPSQPELRSRRSALAAYVWETAALAILALAMLFNFTVLVRIIPLVL